MLELNHTFFIQLINFLLLMYILNRILYKPIMDVLDKRKRNVDVMLKEAGEILERAQATLDEYNGTISLKKKEVLDGINRLRAEVKMAQNDVIEKARKEHEEFFQEHEKALSRKIREIQKELTREARGFSEEIVSKILG